MTPDKVKDWEEGKRDGYEDTDNHRTEKYGYSWDATHSGGRKRREQRVIIGDIYSGSLYAQFLTLAQLRLAYGDQQMQYWTNDSQHCPRHRRFDIPVALRYFTRQVSFI